MKYDFKIVNLSDISVKITKGTTPTSIGCGFTDKGINYIKSESISNTRNLDRTKYSYIDEFTHEKLKRSQIEENDILFSMAGIYLGKTCIVKKEDIPANTNQAVAIIRVNHEKVDYRYIYYCLNQESIVKLVNSSSAQSAQPNINLKDIGNIKINLPNINTQKKVANILSSIDDKIEINSKLNDNLADLIQTVFKRWFIDFEKCNQFVDTEQGSIPENWRISFFGDIVLGTLGGDWGKEIPSGNYTEEVYCVRGADIPDVKKANKGKMPVRYILPKNYESKKLTKNDLVIEISGGSPNQSTGRIALISSSLLSRYDKGMVCTNFCRAIKPIKGYSAFIYYYWQYLYDKKVMFLYENGTTGIKNFDLSSFLTDKSIVIPEITMIDEFNVMIEPIIEQIFKSGIENERLANMRDLLLPKLMSGEIDLDNFEIDIY